MVRSIGAEDYILPKPLTFKEDMDLFEAIHHLLENKVTGATVVNNNNEIVGVISELDCLNAIIDGAYYGDNGGKRVGQYMTREVETIDHISDLDILDIAKKMVDGRRRRFPVVKNGKFAGQVSTRSILQAFKDFVREHDPKEDSILE